MTRLGRDVRGNVIAISAAALIPLAGLIGGGVDMSRLYLTKTRLQQACDAGVLAGRRAMGSGSWTEEGSTSTRSRALELFNANFTDGAYGTTLLDHDFSEDDGEVTGFADVSVPMTIMRIFGITERTMHVTCTAKMEIPNTDVMFVLDVTGSMNCPADGSYCPSGNNNNVPATNARLVGLKSAVKCFYEALLRVNTAEVCGSDPTATTYTGTAQIRLGFMPYSVNVNVGKLLNNDWIANNWSYQSREPRMETVYAWQASGEAMGNWSNWSSAPTNLNTASSYSWGTNLGNNGSTTINGTSYSNNRTDRTSSNCTNLNTNGTILTYTDNGSLQAATVSDYAAPTYPATQQTRTYQQNDNHTVVAYRYAWSNSSCRLQSSSARTYTRSRTTTGTRQISWTDYERVFGWRYKQVSFDVSGLKAGGSSWNNSVALPLTTTTGPTVKLSGSTSDTTLYFPANADVGWDGCIEERATVKNSDGDPSDEWNSIPTGARDMNIDAVPDPSNPDTQWKPMLPGAAWSRYTGTNYNNNWTLNNVDASGVDPSHPRKDRFTYYCSTEAKKLQTWYTPGSFVNYVNSLRAIGNTYHDIGMIWGARFISPTGIFADENRETPTGGAIQRHIIFMTDGATMTSNTNYTAYGIPWWDRRQTTYAPSDSQLDSVLNSRLVALCTAIRNRNITLWVVSYGGGVDSTTEARLQNCATPGKYFKADDTPTLISNFKQIASEIADLRLTN
ncbi:TadE/TadG family type IV pilus assembly protein [Sphingobium sp. B11D3D]|uniref:TadE/TadG family type IV pilus assembly protein n=1 Tax=Sphingobium sp. B11D3D TaxID=2940576 RepID=UPI002223FBDE|nr:Tad domain-containing protein [Sphingobium sp. B11D3D]MCW2369609.1 Flp pilus assembly protein TadG [Sphingobium sp. B11D3D]